MSYYVKKALFVVFMEIFAAFTQEPTTMTFEK